MKWDWQVFYLTALHSATWYSTVSQLLIHLMSDNFHMLKTEQREEIQGSNQSPNKVNSVFIKLDQASVLKLNKLHLKWMLKNPWVYKFIFFKRMERNIYIYTHTYIHTYIHTHIYIFKLMHCISQIYLKVCHWKRLTNSPQEPKVSCSCVSENFFYYYLIDAL